MVSSTRVAETPLQGTSFSKPQSLHVRIYSVTISSGRGTHFDLFVTLGNEICRPSQRNLPKNLIFSTLLELKLRQLRQIIFEKR